MRLSREPCLLLAALLGGLLLSALAPAGVRAQQTEWHQGPSPIYEGTPLQVARAYLAARSHALGLEGVTLEHQSTLALLSYRTVRFRQRYRGLPVRGGAAAVRVAPDGRVTASALQVARELSVDPRPSLSREAAADLLAAYADPRLIERPLRARLAIWAPSGGAGLLVWEIDLAEGAAGTRYTVDAHGGSVLERRPLAVDVLGRVYPISSVSTPATEDRDLPGLDTLDPQVLTGWGGQLVVTNYVSGMPGTAEMVVEQSARPNAGADFLYDPPADPLDGADAFAQVGVYYHISRQRLFYESAFGLDMSAPSWRVVAVANVQQSPGMGLDNAFFSPEGITGSFAAPNLIGIGQGTRFDFGDDSDVFLHEMHHYVSHNAVGYNLGQFGFTEHGLSPFSGGIDEGLSDYFACTENGDSVVGEGSLAVLGLTRDLADTTKSCPADIIGEVHEDGEIAGSFAWTVRELLGKESGDQMAWGAMSMLMPGADFGDLAVAYTQTAADLESMGAISAADVTAVQGAIEARGLDDCGTELKVDAAENERTLTVFGLDTFAGAVGIDCATARVFGARLQSFFHFYYQPSPGDVAARFRVHMEPIDPGELSYDLHVRAGEHVGISPAASPIPGLSFPQVTASDDSLLRITGTDAEIVIDERSDPPFDPTQTYFLAIAHQNCPAAQVTVSAEAAEPSPAPDAGVEEDAGPPDAGVEADAGTGGGSGDGCGCRVGASSRTPDGRSRSPLGLLGLLGVLGALAIRSYRSRSGA